MNILCFGDSLTAGYYNEGNAFHPYSIRLRELLKDSNIDYIGLSGYTSDEMLSTIDKEIITDYIDISGCGLRIQLKKKQYDLCIILAGSNDVADNELPDPIISDIFKLHEIVHEMGTKSIALTIPKIKFENCDENITNIRKKINKALYNGIEQYTNNYRVIDIDKYIGDNFEYIDDDGLHFKPEGYDKIAEYIATFIN